MLTRTFVAGFRCRGCPAGIMVVLAAVAGLHASPSRASDAMPLRVEEPVERALEAGDRHAFKINPDEGVPMRVIVEQLGIDVEIAVEPSSGEAFIVDAPLDRRGQESVMVGGPGPTRITIVGREHGAPPGRYRVRLEPIDGAATETDTRLRAVEAMTEAGRHYRVGTADAWRNAITHYRDAAAQWRALGNDQTLVTTLYAIGVLHRLTDEPGEALGAIREALGVLRRMPDTDLEGYAHNELGLDQWRLGDVDAAREAFTRSATLGTAWADRYLVAAATSNLCLMDLSGGALATGQACYREALPLIEAARAPEIEGAARVNLGRMAEHLGEPEEALAHYERALANHAALGDERGTARTLNNLGVLLRGLGELDAAMARYAEALAVFESIGDERWQARVLNNIGNAYRLLGEPHRAISSFEHALSRFERIADRRGQAATLDNLGTSRRDLGDADAARSLHERALALRRQDGHQRGEAITLRRLGTALTELGQFEAAIARFEAAVAIAVELGDHPSECEARRGLGALHLDLGQLDDARQELEAALELARGAGLRTVTAEVHVLLARVARDADQRAVGHEHVAAAIELLEDVRGRIGSADLRTSYSNLLRGVYELEIELLLAAHHDNPGANHHHRALEVSERARARTLLEHLQEAKVDLDAGVDPALFQQRRSLHRRLLAKAERLAQPKLDVASRAVLEASQLPLLQRLEVVDAQIRRQNPAFAELVRPPALTADDIRALVDPTTILAIYLLAEPRSHLFRVTSRDIDVLALPGRAEIERAARKVHARWSRLDVAQRGDDHAAAAALAGMLRLPGLLAGSRLAIVADGALHVIPFAALPTTNPGEPTAPPQPLVTHTEVVSVPSAAVLAHDRQRPGNASARRSVAILADPVFGPDHARLPGTRQEAEIIAALTNSSLTAFGVEANRALIEDGRLRDFDIVHFATHGVIDTEHPARSGLVLSQVDPDGQPRRGYVSLHDIYQLPLNADLVVLSGCGTALGPEIRGEGLVGLARGFLYAGARRVVASLWKVDDRATAELMTRFYGALWKDGLPPAEALATAQRSLASSRRFRDPYHWAPFVLVGDWR